MSIKRIKPAYFLGTPNLTDPKVLGSKVDEMIVAINDLEPLLDERVYVSEMFNTAPFYITPTLVPTATKIINKIEGSYPGTALVGYKVTGMVDVEDYPVNIYLGSLLPEDMYLMMPFKVSGLVNAYDDNFGLYQNSSLASGAYFEDTDDGIAKPVELCSIATEYISATQTDLYLVVTAPAFAGDIRGTVSFEYEFLIPENKTIDFIIY